MDVVERELIVSRIVAGTMRFRVQDGSDEGLKLCFRKPSVEHIYAAQELYHSYIQELRYMNCLTEEQVLDFMLEEGLWSEEDEKLLTELPKQIEDFKVGLYESTFKANEKKSLRKYLKTAKEAQDNLTKKKQIYYYLTINGAATMVRTRFLVGMSTYRVGGDALYTEDSFWHSDGLIFEQVMDVYFKTRITEAMYRIMARTDPWRSVWNGRKSEGKVFGIPSIELSDEQRNLTMWSNIYDSIYEHPECPPETVIEDDDVLDGWMIIQRKKRKDDLEKRKAEDVVSNEKIRNSGEVFIPVDTMDDAKKLNNDLNDHHAKIVKKQRLAFARKQGEVHEGHMPDTMQYLNSEINRNFVAQARGK